LSKRLDDLHNFLKESLGSDAYTTEPASADASFRRYFRVFFQGKTQIVMDAPPTHENCDQFIKMSRLLANFGLNVPIIIDTRLEQGFLLISDLGTEQYLDHLKAENVEALYADALACLLLLQKSSPPKDLPLYNRELLLREMAIFCEWYLHKHLSIELNQNEQAAIAECFDALAANALQQPQVIVHRDYHSRNLLYTKAKNPGILDFQDAVIGAITYDLVSLLKDCYIAWPEDQVAKWVIGYKLQCEQAGLIANIEDAQFLKWFDLMGTQRHLKAVGIFARLKHRDGKPGYLDDIPRTLNYVYQTAKRYPELDFLSQLLSSPDFAQRTPGETN